MYLPALTATDANEIYPLQPTDVSPELLRCVLPNKVEVEVAVPLAWPCDDLFGPGATGGGGAGPQLALVALQALRSSQVGSRPPGSVVEWRDGACVDYGVTPRAGCEASKHMLTH